MQSPIRFRLLLSEEEYHALVRLSERELRPLMHQVRAILRAELQREGLLEPTQE